MNTLISLLMAVSCLCVFANDQEIPKRNKARTEVKSETEKKAIKTKKKHAKAGKADPNETGSGMTVPAKDQPKLDARPNPGTTVPSTVIPADGSPKP